MTQPASGQDRLTPAQLATLLALVQAQAAVRARLTRTAANSATALLQGFTGWWNPDQVSTLVKKILAVVQPAQRQAARVTDAYLARALTVMRGRYTPPVGAVDITRLRTAISDTAARQLVDGHLHPPLVVLGDTHNGPGPHVHEPASMVVHTPAARPVPAGEQYGRIFEQYRRQVATEQHPEAAAARKATVRLAAVVESDVTLAVRAQWDAGLVRGQDILGYRRILHPERSEHGPCGLCVVAADRVYKRRDLLPLHGNCRCEVLPVLNGMDPGIHLNADDLYAFYQAAGGTGAKGLKKIRVALTENGETGPTLIDADQHYRSPVDVAHTLLAAAH